MKWSTEIAIDRCEPSISYTSEVLLLGSCFATHLADKLAYYQFRHSQNPFGIVFHPLAIKQLIERAINQDAFTEQDLFEQDGIWHSFWAHSSCSGPSKAAVLTTLNKALEQLHQKVLNATHVVLTFGTAWVYRHIESDVLVANCHKVPQRKFLKELLTADAVSGALDASIVLIRAVNPNATIITTVSPVRHLKDGVTENSRSKAHLLTGVHDALEAHRNAFYFPSYEIMMDELREYRFYKSDLIHPNEVAIDHIWERFQTAWIAEDAKPLQKKIENIRKGMAHRPLYPNDTANLSFQQKLQREKDAVSKQLPHARW